MAEKYPHASVYAEHHVETLQYKIEQCHRIINRCMRFTNNPSHYQAHHQNLSEIGDLFEDFSCEISKFALEYYLHEVVTPGVPEFASVNERNGFWRCICSNKLIAIKHYLDEEQYYRDTNFLNALYAFVNNWNAQVRKILNISW